LPADKYTDVGGMIILSVACHIFIFGDGMSHRQNEREPIMDFTNNQNISGSSADSFAEELRRVCQRGAHTPEENKRLKAELEFNIMKRRADAKVRRREALTQRAKQIFKVEISDE
jgi:hypothetical protein